MSLSCWKLKKQCFTVAQLILNNKSFSNEYWGYADLSWLEDWCKITEWLKQHTYGSRLQPELAYGPLLDIVYIFNQKGKSNTKRDRILEQVHRFSRLAETGFGYCQDQQVCHCKLLITLLHRGCTSHTFQENFVRLFEAEKGDKENVWKVAVQL